MNPTKKEKILIIESNPDLGERITKALKAEGYLTFLVKTGEEGLKAIYDILPQLVVLDLILTDTDAYDILAKKHADVMLSKIPVILLSTQGETINMRQVPENSVTDFVMAIDQGSHTLVARINTYFGHESVEAEIKSKPKTKPKSIFWVEDDRLIGTILEKKFITGGFEVFRSHNGDEALIALKDIQPDIIILDITLPDMDGFEILQKIRNDSKFKKTPVMILSNLSKPSDFEKAKVLGASKYLVKASSSLDQIVSDVIDLTK